MDKIKLKIIQPQKIVLEDEFDHVIIPGKDGDFGVYAGHTPFITVIRPGVMELYDNDNIKKFAIHDGYVSVEKDIITVLCETIEADTEIDSSRAKAALERAEKRIKSQEEDIDYRRAEIALKKAMARLQIN